MNNGMIDSLLLSRQKLLEELQIADLKYKGEEEGGCGVVGFCASEPVAARYIHEPSKQMHNRGNGKGGGIAALGFVPEQLGVTREVLDNYYMLHIAFLDNGVRTALEEKYLAPNFEIHTSRQLDTVDNWQSIPSLEAKPPDVMRYFVRTKPAALDAFIAKHGLASLPRDEADQELISQLSTRINLSLIHI